MRKEERKGRKREGREGAMEGRGDWMDRRRGGWKEGGTEKEEEYKTLLLSWEWNNVLRGKH